MRTWGPALAAAVLICLAAQSARSADLSPRQILSEVATTYRQLHDYRIEAEQNEVVSVPLYGSATSQVRVTLAAEAPGKMRVSVKEAGLNLLVVSDGRSTWWYLPNKKIYTRVMAAANFGASRQEANGEQPNVAAQAVLNLVGRYTDVESLAPGAVLKRKAHLKLQGKKIPCYVLELRQAGHTHEIWVDAERFLVLRHKEVSMRESNGRQVTTEIETKVKRVSLGAPAAVLFSFVPPSRAHEVQALGIPGERVTLAGKTAADFTLKDTRGEKVSLSDLRGKVVLLDFWATWCPPCREELPHVDDLYHKLKGHNAVVLGVSDEGRGTVRSFLKKHSYDLPTLVDSSDAVHKMYGVQAVPTLVIINPRGVVVADYVGERTEEQLTAALKTAGLSD